MTQIVFQREEEIDAEEARELYDASTLGARRPIDDAAIFRDMLRHADLLVTARDAGRLIGLARTLTDWSYVAYLADLAVRESHQRRGIGRELVRVTRATLGPRAMIVLLAAPAAVDYYPRLGFSRHPSAWILRPGEPLADE